MPVVIREALPQDEAVWRSLWLEYCDFYGIDLAEEITETLWRRILDPGAAIHALVAVAGDAPGRVVGFANYVLHPYTWGVEQLCYLEDLFVSETARGQGAGRALIDEMIYLAKVSNWPRLYWHTHEDNADARRLYDSITPVDPFVRYLVRTSR